MMRRIAFLFVLGIGVASAQPKPVLRIAVTPPTGVIVGQPVKISVDVLAPNFLTDAPELPQLEIPNAITVLSDEAAQNLTETINGTSYAGVRKTYRVYPQRPGRFEIPTAEVKIKYAAVPPNSVEATLPLPAASFQAMLPPEAEGLDYFLPATELRIEQTFDRKFKDLKVGDTLRRTITIIAVKTQAMMIPPIYFEAQKGIREYTAEPEVTDQKSDHGEFLQGQRTEHVTYQILKPGDYVLPEIQVTWWDLQTSKLRVARLPAIHFTAAPNLDYVPELTPEVETVNVPPPIPWWR